MRGQGVGDGNQRVGLQKGAHRVRQTELEPAWLEGAVEFGFAEKDQEESEKEGLREPAQPGQV